MKFERYPTAGTRRTLALKTERRFWRERGKRARTGCAQTPRDHHEMFVAYLVAHGLLYPYVCVDLRCDLYFRSNRRKSKKLDIFEF